MILPKKYEQSVNAPKIYKFSTKLLLIQVVIQRAAIEQDAQAAVQPQHSQRHRVNRAVNIGIAVEILHIDGKNVGEHQPSRGSQNSPGETVHKAVSLIGQHHEHQGKNQALQNQQQKKIRMLKQL